MQGSVLGPLLYLMYIKDITDLFSSAVTIKLFADKMKIYLEITDVGLPARYGKITHPIAI